MDPSMIECESAERDAGCGGARGPSLAVLGEVQRAYEERMEGIDTMHGNKKLQMQVKLLRSWVSDLVGQNTLLARAVEDLEVEATSQLLRERRRHGEETAELGSQLSSARRRLARKEADMRGLLEVLRRLREYDTCTLNGIHFFDITADDIYGSCDLEIRKLNKDVHQYEQTILSLRNEISASKFHTPDVSKKDAEVMAGMCCTGAECGDWEPVKDLSAVLREEMVSYKERIHKMETTLKSSGNDVRGLRSVNVALREEIHGLRGACALLAEQCRSHATGNQFKDDIIREMRRQLKQAKSQRPVDVATCVDLRSSTPNSSLTELVLREQTPEVSVIHVESTSAPHTNSDEYMSINEESQEHCDCEPPFSIANLEERFQRQCSLAETSRCQAPGGDVEGDVEQMDGMGNADDDSMLAQILRKADSLWGARCKMRVVETRDNETSTLAPRIPNVKPKHQLETLTEETPTPESIGHSSEVDSPSSSCASARAEYYHNKLLSTLQILQNKEETIRIQTESLSVAEARIASLTSRSAELKREIDRRGRELKALRQTIEDSRVEKNDVSITAQIQEIDNQKNIVTTLQNNLGVIEDLYRECFYETAKQEGLIEMLRNTYLDVRLMDKEKSDQITKLHNVINTQKWSLDKCQDIASDVDSLKVEISNFLNSSNNDSGVWEESLAGDLSEELQDISGQLIRLRELLTGDCICGLKEENTKLRQSNDAMEIEMEHLRRKLTDLENIVDNKDTADKQRQELIRTKENELHLIRQQLAAVEYDTREREQNCDAMQIELQQLQESLKNKFEELARVQTQCQQQEDTIQQLRDELDQAKEINKAYSARRVRSLRADLNKALQHCAHLDSCHREDVQTLETALCEAQARGARLCEEARRAAAGLRGWTRRGQDLHREQEELIKQKESQLRLLRQRLEQGQHDTTLTGASGTDTISQCASAKSLNNISGTSRDGPSCSRCPPREGSFTSSNARHRRGHAYESASEMDSSPPAPPQRLSLLRRYFCENKKCPSTRSASVQRPERCDATTSSSDSRRYHVGHTTQRTHSAPRGPLGGPAEVEDVLTRVESAGAALADSLRRWNKHTALQHT